MTPTPSSVNSSQGPISPDAAHRITRKRNRVPLSCGPCRHRKLKCNRSAPCDNCVKRGDSTSCTYASAVSRRRHRSISGGVGSPDEMQNRIDRLENLVLTLMTNGSQAVSPETAAAVISRNRPSVGGPEQMTGEENKYLRDEDSEIEHVSRSIGVMKVQHDRQFYASEAHWWAILSDIAEVKRYFAEHTKQYEEQLQKVTAAKEAQGSSAATTLLFKGTRKVDHEKILAKFPPRNAADVLIQRFFETQNPAVRILHTPTFTREYEKHWNSPTETSLVWLGMCFAMLSMALNSYHRAGDEPPDYRGQCGQMSETYAEYTAQCLVAADFTQPVNYMIEALIFYSYAEYSRRRDAETGLWMLQGMIARLAMRMGMHRDSKPYKSISPFLGEMRRRWWSAIRAMDILLSFQCGLPSMIHSSFTDTCLPTNLYDEEFGSDTSALPPSRPVGENTPVAFMISHTRLTFVLGSIQEFSLSIGSASYDTAMKLDAELREAYNQIPDVLRLESRDVSSLDSANLVMQRFTLDLAYHKSRCVLHRKFLANARKDPRFSFSRRVCLESCLKMLEHQDTIFREGQPGGRLRSVTWAISTSLTTHDFLLAAMIVCLDLYYTAQAESEGQTSGEMYQWAIDRRETSFKAIGRAVQIWETLKDQSMEAYKASSILLVMMEKLRNHQILRQQLHQNFSFGRSSGDGVAADGHVAPEHSAAMTLGMMSTGLTPDAMGMYNAGFMTQPGQSQSSHTGLTPQPGAGGELVQQPLLTPGGMTPFSNLFGSGFGVFDGLDLPSTNLDWDGWDTYIHGPHPHREGTIASTNLFDMPSFQDGGVENAATSSTPAFSDVPTPASSNGNSKVEPPMNRGKFNGTWYGSQVAGAGLLGNEPPNMSGV